MFAYNCIYSSEGKQIIFGWSRVEYLAGVKVYLNTECVSLLFTLLVGQQRIGSRTEDWHTVMTSFGYRNRFIVATKNGLFANDFGSFDSELKAQYRSAKDYIHSGSTNP